MVVHLNQMEANLYKKLGAFSYSFCPEKGYTLTQRADCDMCIEIPTGGKSAQGECGTKDQNCPQF